jgi:DNA-binding MarR family transcriptional regulator
MDRAADRMLQEDSGLSYARFRVLLALSQGACSQRALGSWLGVTEPSVSRMTRVLASSGLLAVTPDPRGGNRRVVRLTEHGDAVFGHCAALLEGRFADLLDQCDIPREEYAAHTRALIAALDQVAPVSTGRVGEVSAGSTPDARLAQAETAATGRQP